MGEPPPATAAPAGSRIGLSLTAAYAPAWGAWEGLRELVQNWHDGLLASSDASGPELAGVPLEFRPSAAGPAGAPLAFEAWRGGRAVGRCEYAAAERRLLLVNHGVGLGRQVLLLGYSKKAQHQDVIGSFGEGLKVGAVALLRRGLGLRMLTREESWSFELAVDPAFGEKVLTVQVSARAHFQAAESDNAELVGEEQHGSVDLRQLRMEDTASLLEGLREEEWQSLSQRFLFLSPPAESVRTEVGRLLLDQRHAGSLFVRGVWISDDPDLSAGVDLFDIRLDRDRAAVLRKSDLEHQVSSMWVRAVKFNPSLRQRYFELLSADKKQSDVAHAELYCDEDLSEVIAAEFRQRFGDCCIPIGVRDANSSKVAQLRSKFSETTIVVTNALLAVLKKGGVRCELDELLREGEAKARKPVPLASLADKEASCLARALLLAEEALGIAGGIGAAASVSPAAPAARALVSNVDVFDCTAPWGLDVVAKVADDFSVMGRFEIDRRALSDSAVHDLLPEGRCMGVAGESPCWCAPAVLSIRLHAACGAEAKRPLGVERLVARLSASAHAAGGTAPPPPLRCPQLGEEREAALIKAAGALEGLLREERAAHADGLKALQRRAGEAEKELSKTEWRILDAQAATQALQEEWGPELARLRDELAEAQRARALLEEQRAAGEAGVREAQHLRRCLESVGERLAASEEAQRRGAEAAAARESRLRRALARRRELVQKMVQQDAALPLIALADGEELRAAVEEIRAALREEAQQRQCCVCADGVADALLLPCRHQQFCATCAAALAFCPICRTGIEERMQVYVS